MTGKKLGLGDPNRPKFDQSAMAGGTSFQKIQADGSAVPSPPPNQAAFPTPPAGVTGQMPLPTGIAVTPASLTPAEKQGLGKLGWKEGDAIPGNLPQLLAEAQTQGVQQATNIDALPPPTDPTAVPPLVIPPLQDLDDLPPEHRQRITAALAQAQVDIAKSPDTFQPAGPGLGDAASGVVHHVVDLQQTPVIDDRDSPTYANGESKRPDPANDIPPTQAAQRPASAVTPARMAKCPHCEWPLDMPDNPKFDDADKQSFRQAILGGLRWQRQYKLFDGALAVTVRQLTTGEVDACYQQTFHDRKRGKLDNRMDVWEQITRYRMCLQLVDYRSSEGLTPFPESLADWGGEAVDGNPTTLPQIMEQVHRAVLTSESLYRIVHDLVANFNRVAAKLEVMVARPDFCRATGTLS